MRTPRYFDLGVHFFFLKKNGRKIKFLEILECHVIFLNVPFYIIAIFPSKTPKTLTKNYKVYLFLDFSIMAMFLRLIHRRELAASAYKNVSSFLFIFLISFIKIHSWGCLLDFCSVWKKAYLGYQINYVTFLLEVCKSLWVGVNVLLIYFEYLLVLWLWSFLLFIYCKKLLLGLLGWLGSFTENVRLWVWS